MALVQAPTPSGTDAHFGASGTAVPTATVRPPSIARSRCHWRIRAPDLIPSLPRGLRVLADQRVRPARHRARARPPARPETTSADGHGARGHAAHPARRGVPRRRTARGVPSSAASCAFTRLRAGARQAAASTSRSAIGARPVRSCTAVETWSSWPSRIARPKEAISCAAGAGMPCGSRPATNAVVVDRDGLHGPAADRRVQLGQLRARERLGAGDVIGLAGVLVAARQDRDRGGRAVLARDVGGRAVARVVGERPGRGRALGLGDPVLAVERVAQERPGDARVPQRLLGRRVVGRRPPAGFDGAGFGIDV